MAANKKTPKRDEIGDKFARTVIPPALYDPVRRKKWGLGTGEDEPGPCMVELNLQHIGGMSGAAHAFKTLYQQVVSDKRSYEPVRVGKIYYSCLLSVKTWQALVIADQERARAEAEKAGPKPGMGQPAKWRTIFRIWPDFPVHAVIDRSLATIKADAAVRAFAAEGEGIAWAVLDSGVQANHPHFGDPEGEHALLAESVVGLHRCFSDTYEYRGAVKVRRRRLPEPDADPDILEDERKKLVLAHQLAALNDDFGHGTHVAASSPVASLRRGRSKYVS